MQNKKSLFTFLFFLAFLIVAVVIVLLPSAYKSIVQDIKHPGKAGISITPEQNHLGEDNLTALKISLKGIDEIKNTATFLVSGEHSCVTDCGTYTERFHFYQVDADDAESDDIPPMATMLVPNVSDEITHTFTLPIRGHIITYPFDQYEQGLGIHIQRVNNADKSVTGFTPEELKTHFRIHFAEDVSKMEMTEFKLVPPISVKPKDAKFTYDYAFISQYERPMYLKLIVPIVLLITGIVCVFTMVTQPFDKLVMASAAMTLGVFGSRSLILSGMPSDSTLIDNLFLMIVLFNLVALVFKGMNFYHARAGLKLLPWAKEAPKS